MRRIRVIGIGSGGLDQVTVEAVRAMNEVAYFLVTDKRGKDGAPDPLVVARGEILARHLDHEPVLVIVDDPERDRSADGTRSAADYDRAVSDWHAARTDAWEQALLDHDGDAGFLVWGDPAFYDSAIRMLDRVLARGRVEGEVDVLPGISSLQVLAARHRIVLHEVGQPVHVTTGRRLAEAVEQGQPNIAVMLNRSLEPLDDLPDWQIWWGANLGTEHERLVAGRVDDVRAELERARAEVKAAAGWVMDAYLLRRPS
ncbi:precorrin-6A synthase (deacetylating) [Aeromicrobium sp. A1-2]|uniref:precorrin-6A synthase (deacetylating) n=1 Tax=Aeromicrobium sp. A1-2 TaxID=2107713 RepID=UPI001C1FB815|nr:precorrin-6A synthase (deacetylating) [Aeromicrobium sp. A1-2]